MQRVVRKALLCLALLGTVGGCGFAGQAVTLRPNPSIVVPPMPKHPVLSTAAGHYVGVFESNAPESYKGVDSFSAATGVRPSVVLYYSNWNVPFETGFAESAFGHGALPLVEMQPTNISLSGIADGKYDEYLQVYAEAVRSFGHPVIISFGHEMNGDWYSWGSKHASSKAFVAAWRHVVNLFRSVGAVNAVWLWTINDIAPGEAPIKEWWPGSKYVNWVGIDGYYYWPTSTFRSVFGETVDDVRTFTTKPIFIAETAIGPNEMRASQMAGLFEGIKADGIIGIVWFDVAQHDGIYHQNWRLEGNQEALSEFRDGLATVR